MLISDWSSDVCSSELDIIGHFLPRICQHFPLRGGLRHVGVGGKRRFAPFVARNGDLVLLSKFDEPGATGQAPFPPRCNHLDVGGERIIAKLETHLIITLACRTMRRSEEHTSELQSLMRISYAVFCLKKKKKNN